MKSKPIVRICSVVIAVMVILGCAIPAFATNSTSGVVWFPEFGFTGALARYDNGYEGTYSFPIGDMAVLGVEGVNTTNAPLALQPAMVQSAGAPNTLSVNAYADMIINSRVLDVDYKFSNAVWVKLYASNIISYNPAFIQRMQWKSYGGTLVVNVKWYWYNAVTNKYELQTKTSTRTISGNSWTTLPLFDGINIASGNGDVVIIEQLSVEFTPSSAGVTCGVYGIPFRGNTTLANALNSNAGTVIYDNGVPTNAYDLFGWLVEPIEGFFGVEIMPGISLGGIAFVFVAIALVVILLKIFAGG